MRDDIEFNIKFIKLVEQNPPLYDSARCDSIRLVQEQIWEKIAKALNEPVNDVRDRWKNIRSRYAKVQKQMRDTPNKKVKEYYLGPHLHFLDGFINIKPRKRRKLLPTQELYENIETLDADDASSDNDDEFDQSYPLPDRNSDFDSDILLQSNPLHTEEDDRITSHEEDNKAALAYLTEEKRKPKGTSFVADSSSADSDFNFLKSLLPDMAQMTSAQKRYFKICVLNMAGQILEGRETVTVSTSSLSKF